MSTIDPTTWDGYRAHTHARSTGTLVVLVQAADAGIEDDPDMPWALLCQDHHGCCGFDRQVDARYYMRHPEEWCSVCSANHGDGDVVIYDPTDRDPQ